MCDDLAIVNALIDRAEAERERGNNAKAIAIYEAGMEAIIGKSGSGTAYFNLAGCLGTAGDLEGAVIWLRRAIVANPSDKDAYFNAANFSYRLGNFAESVKFFELYVMLCPNDQDAKKLLNGARVRAAGG